MRWTLPSFGGALVLGLAAVAGAAPPGCNGIPLLGTPEEIAATPRADTNLELLSVEMSGGLTADQETYDRVTSDIERIRHLYPETRGVHYSGGLIGVLMDLRIDDTTAAAIDAGTYSDWNCLNDYYELESVQRRSYSFAEYAYLEFEGMYNTSLLAPLYEQLPGVTQAFGYGPGLHRGRSICGLVDSASTYHYFIVVDAFGDCLLGCIYWDVRYFTSSGFGAWPRYRDGWANFEDDPRPPWVDLYEACVYEPTHPLRARIDVVPDPPVLGDSVVLTISGEDGNSACGPFFNRVEVDSVTRTIRVTADFNPACEACPPDATPYSFDVDLGPIPGGEYQVTLITRIPHSSQDGGCWYSEELHGLTQLVVGAPAAPIPVLDAVGLCILSVLVLGGALVILRRNRTDRPQERA